jgi:hypothetical protein
MFSLDGQTGWIPNQTPDFYVFETIFGQKGIRKIQMFHVPFASLITPIVDVFPDAPDICVPIFAI